VFVLLRFSPHEPKEDSEHKAFHCIRCVKKFSENIWK